MKNLNLTLLIFFLLMTVSIIPLGTALASASETYLEIDSRAAPRSEVRVSVFIDSETKINALDLDIRFASDQLKFASFDNTGSIVNFWQGTPNPSSGHIRLTGGILDPWSGQRGLVGKILFIGLVEGESKMSFQASDLYLADGKGTKVAINSSPVTFFVEKNASSNSFPTTIPNEAKDTTPPSLIAYIAKDPVSHRELLVFVAKDDESGIRETVMRYKKWREFSDWQSVENPALLPDGVWRIELRSVNNASLHTVQILSRNGVLYVKFAVPLFFLAILLWYIVKKLRSKKEKIS